uniref:Acylphosphatase-1 n=1 Tax=Cyanistes caeruleus TaxID=156563 RepID=A0A8C0V9X3_CYACU
RKSVSCQHKKLAPVCECCSIALLQFGLTSFCSALSSQGEAKRLGLVGWVQNTSHGTVQGQIQGPTARVQELQEWLRKIGSPQSRISRAEFSNEKKIKALEHKEFQILK